LIKKRKKRREKERNIENFNKELTDAKLKIRAEKESFMKLKTNKTY